MYQPTTRLLTILELLQARTQLSAAELARRLEVDTRTVRRYLTMLQDMGIPIEAVHGRYGGYRLRPGYKLPPLIFTEEEALAVTLGLSAVRWLGLSTAAPATEGATRQAGARASLAGRRAHPRAPRRDRLHAAGR